MLDQRERDDLGEPERAERVRDRCGAQLGRQPLTPAVGDDGPADLDLVPAAHDGPRAGRRARRARRSRGRARRSSRSRVAPSSRSSARSARRPRPALPRRRASRRRAGRRASRSTRRDAAARSARRAYDVCREPYFRSGRTVGPRHSVVGCAPSARSYSPSCCSRRRPPPPPRSSRRGSRSPPSGPASPTRRRSSSPPTGACSWARRAGGSSATTRSPTRRPTPVADLSNAVHDFWDRGLLGMALDPDFTNGRPYIYVLYTYNKDPSDATVPRWPDNCPTPPGATGDGCVVSGRLSRLTLDGVETPLITDWCQQYPSHSVGDLVFGPGRALYVSAGDGASFNFADYGQDGAPVNPCGDPGGVRADPAHRGGRRAAVAGHPLGGRPDRRRRRDPARRPRHRRRAARQPRRRQRRPDDAPDRRARLPQPVPASRSGPARARSGPATSAGTSGRRSTGSPPRPRASATTAGPATRAPAGWAPTTT